MNAPSNPFLPTRVERRSIAVRTLLAEQLERHGAAVPPPRYATWQPVNLRLGANCQLGEHERCAFDGSDDFLASRFRCYCLCHNVTNAQLGRVPPAVAP
jgi:hypothetical protein